MKASHHFKYLVLGLLSALVIDADTQASAFYFPVDAVRSSDFYSTARPIENEHLDDMRGGFVTSNGMVIDFSFSANTLIDGELINQVILDTADLATSASLLRRVIQVGEGNKAFDSATDVSALPDVLTVVQNNVNDLTIQQLNRLDLSVKNMNNFINRSATPEMEFQSTIGLAP